MKQHWFEWRIIRDGRRRRGEENIFALETTAYRAKGQAVSEADAVNFRCPKRIRCRAVRVKVIVQTKEKK